MNDTREIADYCANLALDKKAINMVLLDLRGRSPWTDYFLIMSGTSEPHVKTLAEHINRELKKNVVKPSHTEGFEDGRWALIDTGDIVVHIFQDYLRDFYNLEGLWGDAPKLKISEKAS